MALEDMSFTQRMLIFSGLSLLMITGWNLAFPPVAPEETQGSEAAVAPAVQLEHDHARVEGVQLRVGVGEMGPDRGVLAVLDDL